ncbi:cytidylate kinase-like family protein [bacterium]|nr:cytidylate kinase-like family protein [bacterium]
MPGDPIRLVQALVGAELSSHDEVAVSAVPKGPVVTLSRDYGSGGEDVAHELSMALHVGCFDREILDAIADSAKVDRFLMERLDEQVRGIMDAWAFSIISGKSAFKEDYRRHLVSVILGISQRGGVIVGRGAHLILWDRKAFRVRIVGSLDRCAKRVAEKENISQEEAEKKIQHINQERASFIKNLYRHDLSDCSSFDMVLNSDRYTPQVLARMIANAMRLAGFAVPVE